MPLPTYPVDHLHFEHIELLPLERRQTDRRKNPNGPLPPGVTHDRRATLGRRSEDRSRQAGAYRRAH